MSNINERVSTALYEAGLTVFISFELRNPIEVPPNACLELLELSLMLPNPNRVYGEFVLFCEKISGLKNSEIHTESKIMLLYIILYIFFCKNTTFFYLNGVFELFLCFL